MDTYIKRTKNNIARMKNYYNNKDPLYICHNRKFIKSILDPNSTCVKYIPLNSNLIGAVMTPKQRPSNK